MNLELADRPFAFFQDVIRSDLLVIRQRELALNFLAPGPQIMLTGI
jgi:hypothetical protein